MFESAGGDIGQWLANLFGSSSSSGGSGDYSNYVSPYTNTADVSGQGLSGYSNYSLTPDRTGGGMNWAGLSSGLSNLSKSLGSGSSSGSDTLQASPSVSSTVSGGQLAPKEAGGGASALASMLSNRNQLAQYLMLSAMQGKGRSGGGKGLLG